jgi:hypothetical protein
MMEKLKEGIYVFGEKTKSLNWILNHPFNIAAAFTLIICLVGIGEPMAIIKRALIISLVFSFGLAFLIRIFYRNLCYWAVID